MPTGRVLKKWSDVPVTAEDNFVNGEATDLIAVHNAQYPGEFLRSDAGWSPDLRARVDETGEAPAFVAPWAGTGKLGLAEPHEIG